MTRYALLIEYDGGRFFGFQRQRDMISVQQFLEDTIAIFTKHPVIIHAAGRTDTGVHALGQVAHFDTPCLLDPYKLKGFLNHYGRFVGVSVHKIAVVDDHFHARFSARERTYRYLVINQHAPSPLWEGRALHMPFSLDHERMREAASFFIGHHNFDSFRSKHCQSSHGFRTLNNIDIQDHAPFLTVTVKSLSFLHNQIRIMMGSLLLVGQGKKEPLWIKHLLDNPDRTQSGPTAPPHGLYFEKVTFESDVFA
ncbi:MAG: tRNA pseudouridine(38-40) synthase TruA [Chitinophagaceae bacterium]